MDRSASIEVELDRSGPIPLYHQLARRLEAAIVDGQLARGEFLENETLLAERWQLSRLTVRRAIEELVASGMVVRRRGVGTQVVSDKASSPPRLQSLYDDLVEQGRRPTTTLLAMERVVADDHVADHLQIPPGSRVVFVERCRCADGQRLSLMRNWLTLAAGSTLTAEDLLSSGLYRILRGSGTFPHASTRRIDARAASPVDASLLGIAVGAPLLSVESTMADTSGTIVEYAEQLYVGGRHTLELQVVEH